MNLQTLLILVDFFVLIFYVFYLYVCMYVYYVYDTAFKLRISILYTIVILLLN